MATKITSFSSLKSIVGWNFIPLLTSGEILCDIYNTTIPPIDRRSLRLAIETIDIA